MNNFEHARRLLIADLHKYLVGPAEGESELIPERASDRYHVGSLAPSGTAIASEEDDTSHSSDAGGGDAKSGDGVLTLANAAQQSAMGFTIQVPVGCHLLIDASWADYLPKVVDKVSKKSDEKVDATSDKRTGTEAGVTSENGASTKSDGTTVDDTGPKAEGKSSYAWRRVPTQMKDVDLPLALAAESQTLAKQGGISLEIHERRAESLRILTISLVNRRPRIDRTKRRERDAFPEDRNAYQVQLCVKTQDSSEAIVARANSEYISDPEFLVHELLYRNVRQFSVGHGCATNWASIDGNRASAVSAEWLPASEVFKASSKVESLEGSPALDVERLGAATRDEVVAELNALPALYGQWISGLRNNVDETISQCNSRVAGRMRKVAESNLGACERVAGRIRSGIEFIRDDDLAFRSFALANAAMSQSMKISRPGKKPEWRPFQLAFLLLALRSTAAGDHPERSILDLIWFPTGGGKTEAYLGLVAFSLFHRRLTARTSKEGAGTAVITRYTLRLLTMQQFERAARTVMACEALRRQSSGALGSDDFSIGLFVGNTVTPGDLKTAETVLNGTSEDKSLTTLPVAKCPWCATKLRASRDQRVDVRTRQLVTTCPNRECEFHGGIPIACVDEHLFEHPPSMIIGTVDKFAMMAWEPRIASLFGRTHGFRPPGLIIQDELHLIGDALGSITGLYETAVDLLCSEGGAPPKIVGSTATIRRAAAQTHSVFLRSVEQFPPSGLDHDDSFFYREDRSNPGRMYLGVHAQGRSPKHTLARLIGVLGQGAMAIEDSRARDHYWTLVTYFNSLRELGGAWVLGLDDVPKYIKAMPAKSKPNRKLGEPTELTSHLPSTHIPVVLENMATSLDSDDEDREAIGLLLCTNMISVGVDIDRLGLMIVNGQPKTTAEYIQASSRVGRPEGAAGLVVALYNWTRPRDRSHYERFRSYHESFYRNVESTSVTPFSMRARDRGLHGVFISLLRMRIPALADSPKAIDEAGVSAEVDEIVSAIVERARLVSRSDAVADDTGHELEGIRDKIRSVAAMDGSWNGKGVRVQRRPNETKGVSGVVETPQSMRDVDPPCLIELTTIRPTSGAMP